MTDGDLLPTGQTTRLAFWKDRLDRSDHIRARIGEDTSADTLHIVSACSSRSTSIAGNHWLTVGDAATAFDPLSSQGVAWAIESGLMAAAAIDRYLRGNQRALISYASEVEEEFAIYLKLRTDYYGRERRWPNSAFWRRRHQPWRTTSSILLGAISRKIRKIAKGNSRSFVSSPIEGKRSVSQSQEVYQWPHPKVNLLARRARPTPPQPRPTLGLLPSPAQCPPAAPRR